VTPLAEIFFKIFRFLNNNPESKALKPLVFGTFLPWERPLYEPNRGFPKAS
jgi:hypothetical protein